MYVICYLSVNKFTAPLESYIADNVQCILSKIKWGFITLKMKYKLRYKNDCKQNEYNCTTTTYLYMYFHSSWAHSLLHSRIDGCGELNHKKIPIQYYKTLLSLTLFKLGLSVHDMSSHKCFIMHILNEKKCRLKSQNVNSNTNSYERKTVYCRCM